MSAGNPRLPRFLLPIALLLGFASLLWLPGAARAAGLLIADGGFGGSLEIKDQQVHVTINNGVAVTDVEQVFLNKENRVVEALYTFPVPKGASVSNFSMWIGVREMIGEVVEKDRARQIYESYKTVRRDPGLLEQVDYKRFEMRVFPIAAGAEQRVRVTYYQELDVDHDWASYVYPLATVTRPGINAHTQGRFALTVDARSEVPITAMKSPSHGEDFVIVEHGTPKYWQASLEVRDGDLDRDVVLTYHLEKPRTGVDVITSKQGDEDGYFQATLTAGKELEEINQGADYVFVLDVSGSMAFDGKLGVSRRSVEQFIEALGDQDRFEVITFNVAATPLFSRLADAGSESRASATKFMESRQARGGTVLRPAIELAYRYCQADRPLNVVVLSDGMTEQQEQRELLAVAAQKPAGATLFCVGVGNEVNRPLLAQLAQDAGGLAAFVSQGDDFERQAQAFRRKLTRPAMTGVQIDFQDAEVYDVEPRHLPNLYHGEPLRVYGRYRRGGDVTVTLKAEVLGRPLTQAAPVKFPARDDANPEIERMWAFGRVTRLMEEGRRDGKLEQLKPEIVRLCEGYSIAGEFASFIVLENDAEYQRWKIDRRNLTRVARDRKSQEAVRNELASLREKAQQQLGPQPTESAAKQRADTSSTTSARPNMDRRLGPVDARGLDRTADGGGGGGGAIDPFTALAACGLAAAGLLVRRRRGNRSGLNHPASDRAASG
jgi:Ca-activated chloride channel family protein